MHCRGYSCSGDAGRPNAGRECRVHHRHGRFRGGELALLWGSQYKEYDAVIGIVAGNSIFPR